MSLIHADASVHEFEADLTNSEEPEDYATDPHEGEMLGWLLPVAITVISSVVLWSCNHFGWLQ